MRRAGGFTLLEVMVAIVILAFLGLMAYEGVTQTRIATEGTRAHMDRLRAVQRAAWLLTSDLRALSPRPVRETLGDGYRPALYRDPNATTLVELSRAGWPNGAGTPRGTVQRVSYRLEDRRLLRSHWTVTDPTLSNEPVERVLLEDVEGVEIRYLDYGGQWDAQWPPLGGVGDLALRLRPAAVEIVIDLADYGRIRRIVEVAG